MDWQHCQGECWEAMGYANRSPTTSTAEGYRFLQLCVLCRCLMSQTILTLSTFWIARGRRLPTAMAEVCLDRSSLIPKHYRSLQGKAFRPAASTASPSVFL